MGNVTSCEKKKRKCDMCKVMINTNDVLFYPYEFDGKKYHMCAYCRKEGIMEIIDIYIRKF